MWTKFCQVWVAGQVISEMLYVTLHKNIISNSTLVFLLVDRLHSNNKGRHLLGAYVKNGIILVFLSNTKS